MSTDKEIAEGRLALLQASLEVSVPMYIARLQKVPWSVVQAQALASAQTVAEKGDIIMFRGGKKGETAAAFNALAAGIATLAFAPGGATVFGLHFESQHPEALSTLDITEIGDSLKRGVSVADLANEFPASYETIEEIGKRGRKKTK